MDTQEISAHVTVETTPDPSSSSSRQAHQPQQPPHGDMAPRGQYFRSSASVSQAPTWDLLLGRWRLSLDLFGRVFMEDVGLEPGSIVSELRGFPVKEARFRRHMEKLRNAQQRDLTLSKMERNRTSLLVQTFKELNTHFGNQNRRIHPPLAFNRVKVTFKDEPGEGSGVARSFYTSIAEALLANEKLPNLEAAQVGQASGGGGGAGGGGGGGGGAGGASGGGGGSQKYSVPFGSMLRHRGGSAREQASSASAAAASSSSSSSSSVRRISSSKILWRPSREQKKVLNYDARPFRPTVAVAAGAAAQQGSGHCSKNDVWKIIVFFFVYSTSRCAFCTCIIIVVVVVVCAQQ